MQENKAMRTDHVYEGVYWIWLLLATYAVHVFIHTGGVRLILSLLLLTGCVHLLGNERCWRIGRVIRTLFESVPCQIVCAVLSGAICMTSVTVFAVNYCVFSQVPPVLIPLVATCGMAIVALMYCGMWGWFLVKNDPYPGIPILLLIAQASAGITAYILQSMYLVHMPRWNSCLFVQRT